MVAMLNFDLREPRVKPGQRPPRPSPPMPMFREFPFWRRIKRVHPEHWLAAGIVLIAFANAARALT
jgi:hypothetical protein